MLYFDNIFETVLFITYLLSLSSYIVPVITGVKVIVN